MESFLVAWYYALFSHLVPSVSNLSVWHIIKRASIVEIGITFGPKYYKMQIKELVTWIIINCWNYSIPGAKDCVLFPIGTWSWSSWRIPNGEKLEISKSTVMTKKRFYFWTPARDFAYTQFFHTLEVTVEELTKCFLLESGENRSLSFGRCAGQKSYNELFDGLKNLEWFAIVHSLKSSVIIIIFSFFTERHSDYPAFLLSCH